ncbi:MAG: CocE/NonD family hydrolase, partial [Armatimonadota bacterium]
GFSGIGERGATDVARSGQRLLIGPWGHSTVGQREYGEWDFGPDAALKVDDYEVRFLDLWLRDTDDGISEQPPVNVFLMGENRWVGLADWPPPEAQMQQWYLCSAGDAAGLGGDGRLSREGPTGSEADEYLYDPRDPCPTRGGPIYWGLSPAGPVEQRPILTRPDVLYYRSDILGEPLTVMGSIELDLWFATGAEDTDIVAKLCVVEPSGRVISLTGGSLRCRYRESWSDPSPLTPDEPARLRLHLGNLAYTFPAGSRVALIVTGSSFPRILPHPNTMAPTWSEDPPVTARQRVLHTEGHESRLLLPVV